MAHEKNAEYGINHAGSKGRLGVFNAGDFSHVKTCEFDRPIVQMSYVDGVCYVVLFQPYVLLRSTDFENWEAMGENLGVPVALGNRTIMRTYGRQGNLIQQGRFYAMQNPILFVNGKPAQSIDVEGIDFNSLQVVGDYFMASNAIAIPNEGKEPTFVPSAFFYSKDGVYWAKQEVPDEDERQLSPVTTIKIFEDKLYVGKPHTEFFVFDLADLEATVPKSDVYVQVGNEILGFETPPVTDAETGRTLVPMRFLLEKLGADVGWYAEHQMIVAQKDGLSVEMTVGNPIATVNGQSVEMDTAPRVINNRTMIPLRFLSENLGYDVEWNETTKTAVIRTQGPTAALGVWPVEYKLLTL